MFGLSRNALFGIGGVLLAGVLYLGFSGSDEPGDKAKAAKHDKGKGSGKKKAGKKRKAAPGALGVGKICVKLDCSEEQLTRFKALVKAHRTETASNRRALREAHALIAAEYSEATLNEAALDEAYESIEEQRLAVDENARTALATLHKDLTPTQREALAKLVALHGPAQLFARPAESGPSSSGKGKGKKGRGKKGRGKNGHGKRKGRHKPNHAKAGLTPDGPGTAPVRQPSAVAPKAEAKTPPRGPIAPVKPAADGGDEAGTGGA